MRGNGTGDQPASASLPEGAADWVREHLSSPLATADGVRDTARSVVARLTSEDESVAFFKADRILPPPECAVVSRLAERWPDRVVPLIAVEEQRGWSLTGDVGAHGLDGASTSDWCRLVRQFGEVQRDSGRTAEDWLALGCRDLRGARMNEAMVAMLDDAAPDLDDDVRAVLDGLRPRIAETCADLAGDGIPAALVHQDLVPENVVLCGEHAVFLDWSDTVVAHPFHGCDRLLDFCWTDAERKSAVIDAYLSSFEGVVPEARLRASFQSMLWLRVLYEDVRWHHEMQAAAHDAAHVAHLRQDLLLGLTMVAKAQRPRGHGTAV